MNKYFTTCDRCKRTYHSISVARCRHPTVKQYYGTNICLYCCMKCKHHYKAETFDAIGCNLTLNYGGDNNG